MTVINNQKRVKKLQDYIERKYPFLATNIHRQIEKLGKEWIKLFEIDLKTRITYNYF